MEQRDARLRILQTPPRFFPYIGGVEKLCLDLCRSQVRAGHQVKVLCATHAPGHFPVEHQGIVIRRLKPWFRIAATPVTLELPFCLAQEQYDVMHTHLPTPWSADWSVILAKLAGKPSVVTFHNEIVGRGVAGLMAKVYNLTALRLTLRWASSVVLTSAEGGRRDLDVLRACQNKITVIPPGIDTGHFHPMPQLRSAGTVFFLSLLDEYHQYKGLSYLLQAMQAVCRELPQARLVVGGDGALRARYETLARALGIAGKVEFRGFIAPEELLTMFNRASVFVLPSIDSQQEGFGIVLAEALACEVPVVTTEAVGLAKAIRDAEAGIVVPACDGTALGHGIIRLLTEQALAEQMGRNGRRLIEERYSSTVVSQRYEEVYRSCMKL